MTDHAAAAINEFWPGIRRLKFGPLGLNVGEDGKLVIYPREGDRGHLTVLFETHSGEFDVHWKTADGRYVPLLRLPTDRIPQVLSRVADEVMPLFLSLLRPLRAGWLAHHGIGLAAFTELDTDRLRHLGGHGGNVLRLDATHFDDLVVVPDSLEALHTRGGLAFVLVATRRPRRGRVVGTAFSLRRPDGVVVAHWIKTRDFARFETAVAAAMKEAAVAHGAFVADRFRPGGT